jgi:hypothetical protein
MLDGDSSLDDFLSNSNLEWILIIYFIGMMLSLFLTVVYFKFKVSYSLRNKIPHRITRLEFDNAMQITVIWPFSVVYIILKCVYVLYRIVSENIVRWINKTASAC